MHDSRMEQERITYRQSQSPLDQHTGLRAHTELTDCQQRQACRAALLKPTVDAASGLHLHVLLALQEALQGSLCACRQLLVRCHSRGCCRSQHAAPQVLESAAPCPACLPSSPEGLYTRT